MTTILHVDASARNGGSISRDLSSNFIGSWREVDGNVNVIRRDLSNTELGFVTEEWIAAAFTPRVERSAEQNELLSTSDLLINEVREADFIVIGTPMYNYGMPAILKTWVDHVIRVNETFSFSLDRGDWPLEPTMAGKKLVVLSSKGEFGFDKGGIRAHMNYLDGHLEAVSHYLGCDEKYFIASEYQEFGGRRHDQSKEAAISEARRLARMLASKYGQTSLQEK